MSKFNIAHIALEKKEDGTYTYWIYCPQENGYDGFGMGNFGVASIEDAMYLLGKSLSNHDTKIKALLDSKIALKESSKKQPRDEADE